MFINTYTCIPDKKSFYGYHKIYLETFSESSTWLSLATQAALSCSAGCIYALLNANSFIFLYIYYATDGWPALCLLRLIALYMCAKPTRLFRGNFARIKTIVLFDMYLQYMFASTIYSRVIPCSLITCFFWRKMPCHGTV